MRTLYISVLTIIFVLKTQAQQLPLSSQFEMNRFLLNPAITGNVDYIPLRLTARQQWVGVDNAPSTQSLSAHKLLKNETMGVGGYIFADRFGPEKKVGFQANYSYIISLDGINSKLSFGVAFKAFQYKLDYSELVSINENDLTLNTNEETAFVPDADFGIYMQGEKYFAGISVTQLIQVPIEISGQELEENSMVRHYYLLGGYKYKLNDNVDIEPSFLVKGTELSPFQADFNIKGIYKKNYNFGISYRTSKTIIAMIGLTYNNFVFGYAFDYAFSDLQNVQSGTHEIVLGYNFRNANNKGSTLL